MRKDLNVRIFNWWSHAEEQTVSAFGNFDVIANHRNATRNTGKGKEKSPQSGLNQL
jgi:hypothetical protein